MSTGNPENGPAFEVTLAARKPQRFDLRRVFRLPLLSAEEGGRPAPPRESEVLFELTGDNPENRLFGRFDAAEVRDRLSAAGLLRGLAARGYPDPTLSLSCSDPADQRICLHAGEATRDRLLMEARLQLSLFHPRHPIGPFTEESSFRMLVIHWLVLSDPGKTFSVERPRLPGQERPGLGLAIAGATSRIALGTSVLVLPWHHPIRLAKTVASLDDLSGGRVILGVGVAETRDEYANLGIDFAQRGRIADDYLEELHRLWTEDVPSYAGRYVSFTGLRFEPKSHAPVWVGGSSAAAYRRTARFGDGWHPLSLSPAAVAAGLGDLRAALTAAGRDAAGFRIAPRVVLEFVDEPWERPVEQRRTGPADLCYRLLLKLGKKPVRVLKEVPGFLFNRLQLAVYREALHCLENGVATAEDIDRVVKAGYGFRLANLGPLETSDFGGLDTFYRLAQHLFPNLSDAKSAPAVLEKLVRKGNLGVKIGVGFYPYPPGVAKKKIRERDRRLIRQLKLFQMTSYKVLLSRSERDCAA